MSQETTSAESASDRLIKLVPGKNRIGISLEDAAQIPLDEQTRKDILSCLHDENPSEAGWGLWFAEALLVAGKLDPELRKTLIRQIPSFLKSDNHQLRGAVMTVLIRLRNEFPGYRTWMLKCLRDPSPTVRCSALLNCKTFLKPGEIEPLLHFKDDDDVSETGGMGGPLVYTLRDEALAQIEDIVGKKFPLRNVSSEFQGQTVSWRDWSFFLNWYNQHTRKWYQFW